MTTSAVMLLGIAANRVADGDQSAFTANGPWPVAATSCLVTQMQLAPSVVYSADDQGYVVSTITFDEVPPACVGLVYHLSLVAQDGTSVFEATGVLRDDDRKVPIPAAARPRADGVSTTVLSVLPEGASLRDGVA